MSKHLRKTDHRHHRQAAVSSSCGRFSMLFPDVTPTLHADMPFKQFSIGAYLSLSLSAHVLAGSLPGYVMSRCHTS